MADGDGDGDDEQRAEAVPNEIPNDCDMATKLVPREIEREDYREPNRTQPLMEMFTECLPNGITRESRDNYQQMITEIWQQRIFYRSCLPRWRQRSRIRTHRLRRKIVCRWSESPTELRVESQRDYDYDHESRLHCYRATMAIDNRYDEVVDGATNFQKKEMRWWLSRDNPNPVTYPPHCVDPQGRVVSYLLTLTITLLQSYDGNGQSIYI